MAADASKAANAHRDSIRSISFKRQASMVDKRLLLLVDATIRDMDLNKAIRRLRMKREQELLVREELLVCSSHELASNHPL